MKIHGVLGTYFIKNKKKERSFNGEDGSLYRGGREDVGTIEIAQLAKALATQREVSLESHVIEREPKIIL